VQGGERLPTGRATWSSSSAPSRAPSRTFRRGKQALTNTYTEGQVEAVRRLFDAHGMDLVAPLPVGE
jgi:hypothetical protein